MLAQNKAVAIFLSGKQLMTKNAFSTHGICALTERILSCRQTAEIPERGEVHHIMDLNYSG